MLNYFEETLIISVLSIIFSPWDGSGIWKLSTVWGQWPVYSTYNCFMIYIYFWSKVNIWNINCAGNSIHFRHTNGCSCESVKVFEIENVSTWGGLELTTFGFMQNALTYWAIRARHLLSHVFEHWLWRYRYFLSKVNIWNVNCARATAFIFDRLSCESVKVFETENVSTIYIYIYIKRIFMK